MDGETGTTGAPGAEPPPPEPDFSSAAPKVEGLKASADLAKQIITLCAGMIALTITFLKDIVSPAATGAREVPSLMIWAWVMYVAALLGAIGTLMGAAGSLTVLDQMAMKLPVKEHHKGAYDSYAWNVRAPMLLMCVGFLAAIILTIAAAATD